MKRWLPVVLFLALMWGVLVGVANFAGGSNTLVCARDGNGCTISHRPTLWIGHQHIRFAASLLRGARLEDNGSRSRRIVIDFESESGPRSEPLTTLYVRTRSDGTRDRIDGDVERINAFAAGQTAMVTADDGGDPTTPLLVAVGTGALATVVAIRGVAGQRRRRR